MNKSRNHGGSWPTRQQELLLQAALCEGEEAVAAWRAWKSAVDLDLIDPSSLHLLTLLQKNLRALGVEDPAIDKYKGVYRKTWYRNQTRFREMALILRAFHSAGIRTMVLKGTALTLLHYKDYGLRPMNDFDVMVDTGQAPAAIGLLTKLGWKPERSRRLEQFTEAYFSTMHSYGFEDPAGRQFDLHWHLMLECCYAGADDDLWAGAVPVEVSGVKTTALNPTDQLLHVCVHGARWNRMPPMRWVADAITIIRTSQGELDWDRLVAQAEKRHLTLQVEGALNYLRGLLNAPVPPATLRRLRGIPVSAGERWEYKFRLDPTGRNRKLRKLTAFWYSYLRSSQMVGNPSIRRKLGGFMLLLQHRWEAEHLWQVPLCAAAKAVQRFGKPSRVA